MNLTNNNITFKEIEQPSSYGRSTIEGNQQKIAYLDEQILKSLNDKHFTTKKAMLIVAVTIATIAVVALTAYFSWGVAIPSLVAFGFKGLSAGNPCGPLFTVVIMAAVVPFFPAYVGFEKAQDLFKSSTKERAERTKKDLVDNTQNIKNKLAKLVDDYDKNIKACKTIQGKYKSFFSKQSAFNRIAKNPEQINEAYQNNDGAFINFLDNRLVSIKTFKEKNEKYKQQAEAILQIADAIDLS